MGKKLSKKGAGSKQGGGDNKTPHDHFFRAVMEQPKVLRDFLENHLPTHVVKLIDLNKVELMPDDFVTLANKKLHSDLICKVLLAEREAYLVTLIEHQSTPDPMMAFRILRYTCEIMNKHLSDDHKLPLVIPLVIYHGERAYQHSTDVRHVIDAPQPLIDEFFLQPFKLIDLSQLTDEALMDRLWSGLALLALKRSHSDEPVGLKNVLITAEKMYFFQTDESRQVVRVVLDYVLSDSRIRQTKELEKELSDWVSKPFREEFMTLGQAYEEQGKIQGRLEGKIEGKLEGKQENQRETVLRMLSLGLEMEMIERVTLLTQAEIEALKATTGSASDQH